MVSVSPPESFLGFFVFASFTTKIEPACSFLPGTKGQIHDAPIWSWLLFLHSLFNVSNSFSMSALRALTSYKLKILKVGEVLKNMRHPFTSKIGYNFISSEEEFLKYKKVAEKKTCIKFLLKEN